MIAPCSFFQAIKSFLFLFGGWKKSELIYHFAKEPLFFFFGLWFSVSEYQMAPKCAFVYYHWNFCFFCYVCCYHFNVCYSLHSSDWYFFRLKFADENKRIFQGHVYDRINYNFIHDFLFFFYFQIFYFDLLSIRPTFDRNVFFS